MSDGIKKPATNAIESSTLLAKFVRILDLYEGGDALISCQGQGMDGYTALAEFVAIAKEARVYMANSGINGKFPYIGSIAWKYFPSITI